MKNLFTKFSFLCIFSLPLSQIYSSSLPAAYCCGGSFPTSLSIKLSGESDVPESSATSCSCSSRSFSIATRLVADTRLRVAVEIVKGCSNKSWPVVSPIRT